jgi:hypothetical protein
MGNMTNAYRILMENLKERNHLEDTDIDGRIIFELISGK